MDRRRTPPDLGDRDHREMGEPPERPQFLDSLPRPRRPILDRSNFRSRRIGSDRPSRNASPAVPPRNVPHVNDCRRAETKRWRNCSIFGARTHSSSPLHPQERTSDHSKLPPAPHRDMGRATSSGDGVPRSRSTASAFFLSFARTVRFLPSRDDIYGSQSRCASSGYGTATALLHVRPSHPERTMRSSTSLLLVERQRSRSRNGPAGPSFRHLTTALPRLS